MLPRGLHLHLDCPSGIAGDMTLGALLDAGVDPAPIREALAALDLPGLALRFESVRRGGLRATQVHAPEEPAHGPARHWHAIRTLLTEAPLSEPVRARALETFTRLAEAEASVHGVAPEAVHFHELGGLDALLDIVGVAAAMAHLAPSGVTASPVPLGAGTVQTAHGTLPVPAPATAVLLASVPVVPSEPGSGELVTPTGAALLRTYVQTFGPPPPMRLVGQGLGAGSRERPGRPNVVRLLLGEPIATAATGAPGSASVTAAASAPGLRWTDGWIEGAANLDDMSPELGPYVLERLFEAGARDAWFTPITMKKGRAAVRLGFLCPEADLDAVSRALLRESTTLGLRYWRVSRRELSRRLVTVQTPYGAVRVKEGGPPEGPWTASPEHEDCRARAQAAGVPLKAVYRAALTAHAARLRRPEDPAGAPGEAPSPEAKPAPPGGAGPPEDPNP